MFIKLNMLRNRIRQMSVNEAWHRLIQVIIWPVLFVLRKLFPIEVGSICGSFRCPHILVVDNHSDNHGFESGCHGYTAFELSKFERNNHIATCKIRRQDEIVDIRSVWESARLQDALQWVVEADGMGQETVEFQKQNGREIIFKWLANNPLGIGPHYMSAMECGLRIPVFAYALVKPDNLNQGQRDTLVRAIYEHAWFISHRLSLYSSLGNHTVCECVGLVFAGAIFKNDNRGRKWLGRAVSLLEQELAHQILEDGGPAEQSINYHRFVLDLYWLVVDVLEINGLYDCAVWKSLLERGETFLRCFELANGQLPAIGDSDDGYALGPGLSPVRGASTILQEKAVHVFQHSGYTVLNGPAESKLIFDHGPLGMAPLYNHGHADTLSVLLSLRGVPILIDPGTYRYNGVPEWRRYFKSTRAHNTVTVDGLDQAVFETGFIWSHPWHISEYCLNEEDEGLTISAAHDGYARLQQPVMHHRSIRQESSGYLIIDTFSGNGSHDFELNYHLHPDVEAEEENGVWLLTKDSISCRIHIESGSFTLSKGDENPIKGWFSPAYNQKTPCPVLSCCARGETDQVTFITRIKL